jgi:aspartate/methionine/tyrosine aminotransferase
MVIVGPQPHALGESEEAMLLDWRPSRMVQEQERFSLRVPLARTMGAIDSAVGDPDFPTPSHGCQALGDAIRKGTTLGAPSIGDEELWETITVNVSQRSGCPVSMDEGVVFHGAAGALAPVTAILGEAVGARYRPPQGTFYAFVPHSSTISSAKCAQLAREQGVLVRSGNEFGLGGEGSLRIAFCIDRGALVEGRVWLRELLERLIDAAVEG